MSESSAPHDEVGHDEGHGHGHGAGDDGHDHGAGGEAGHGHGGGHGGGVPRYEDGPHLAHHFDTHQQQFDAGKLGIWLFLVTEVLFFAGLFCAYSLYRTMHPEIFVWAHYYLDTNLGAVNTSVLILSSLTAAWAVRNAQMQQKKLLLINIVVTILCACTFMVVKYKEYSHKYHDGLLWGKNFHPAEEVWETENFKHHHPQSAALVERMLAAKSKLAPGKPGAAAEGAAKPASVDRPGAHHAAEHEGAKAEHEGAEAKFEGPIDVREAMKPLLAAGVLGDAAEGVGPSRPRNAHVFFGIYFFMTGLHGFHVTAGIAVWIWLLIRAVKGQFGPKYFGPIDYAALYWHLVDLIWIYLFPLLYLIH